MAAPALTAATLIAQLLGEALRGARGLPGVLVQDVPHLDADAILRELQTLRSQDVDLRIAYLNPDAVAPAQRADLPNTVFSVRVEDAEKWRNSPGLSALIVVITEADTAKLTSLEDFVTVGPALLRGLLVERAAVQFGEINEVLPRWWVIIGHDDQISFSDLLDYYLALSPLDGERIKEEAALQINRLGLLPDPGFFDNPGEKQLRARLDENRALALRLANFSEEDRQKVEDALAKETDNQQRAVLRRRLRDLQEYRRGGQLSLTAANARQLLKIRTKQAVPKPVTGKAEADEEPPPPPAPKDLTSLAVENLLTHVAVEEDEDPQDTSASVLDTAVATLREQLDDIEDTTVRPKQVKVTLPSGSQIDHEVQTDVLNLVNRMVGEGKYGGLVRAVGDDIAAMVRNFQQSAEVVDYWDGSRIREFLDAFVRESTSFEPILRAFDEFEAHRDALLPYLGELGIAPLLLAVLSGLFREEVSFSQVRKAFERSAV
jgi:hypothetical protein